MRRAVIESPYAGDTKRNATYAVLAVKHSLALGEAPIASHLLFPENGIVDENDPEGRRIGIAAGLAWVAVAEIMALYVDYGISPGMAQAEALADKLAVPVEYRKILDG